MSEFDVEEGVLLRNDRAFVVVPPAPGENSSYWITRALVDSGCQDKTSIRLDPLIQGDAKEFPRLSYRMLWWGPPMLWKDVVGIKEEQFGRWAPASLGSRGEYTDFAWVPGGGRVRIAAAMGSRASTRLDLDQLTKSRAKIKSHI